jgi:diguanylate cyclase (GGDEF)-like protein
MKFSRKRQKIAGISILKYLPIRHWMLLVLLLIPPLAGSRDAAANDALQVIDFQLRWKHQFQFAGYYAAIEQGYYREEGLDVRLHEGAPGRTPVQEVLVGRAQYAEANSELLYERLKGKPLVALAAIFQHSPSVLLARADAGIHSPHDLVGKKVMLMDAVTDADFHTMFLNEGINADAIKILPSSYDIGDLAAGKVAAFNSYLTNEPYFLQQQKVAFVVINPSSYGVDFYSDILFTSEQELKQHPARVEAFRRATIRGWHYAMDHPAELIDVLINKYKVAKSREHLQFEANAMRPLILPDLIEIGHMNPGRWKHMADTFVKVGMADENYSLEGFIYNPNPPHEVANLRKLVVIVSIICGAVLLVALALLAVQRRLRKEIELRKIAEEEVKKLAYNDSLTGMPNRNSFLPYASKQVLSAHRAGQKLALCYIDLNNFKEINDTFGHIVGDLALVHVAKAISSVIRESDMAARLGGDEFGVLLTGIHHVAEVQRITDEIQQVIAKPFHGDLSVTASIGVAVYPEDGNRLEALMSKADTAMFQNKAAMKSGSP